MWYKMLHPYIVSVAGLTLTLISYWIKSKVILCGAAAFNLWAVVIFMHAIRDYIDPVDNVKHEIIGFIMIAMISSLIELFENFSTMNALYLTFTGHTISLLTQYVIQQ